MPPMKSLFCGGRLFFSSSQHLRVGEGYSESVLEAESACLQPTNVGQQKEGSRWGQPHTTQVARVQGKRTTPWHRGCHPPSQKEQTLL